MVVRAIDLVNDIKFKEYRKNSKFVYLSDSKRPNIILEVRRSYLKKCLGLGDKE